MSNVLKQGKTNADFMKYFPDSIQKKNPPKDYFWKIYSSIMPDVFKEMHDKEMIHLKKKIKKSETIQVQREHLDLMKKKHQNNMSLLIELRKPGVQKNIQYLAKSERTKTEKNQKSI